MAFSQIALHDNKIIQVRFSTVRCISECTINIV